MNRQPAINGRCRAGKSGWRDADHCGRDARAPEIKQPPRTTVGSNRDPSGLAQGRAPRRVNQRSRLQRLSNTKQAEIIERLRRSSCKDLSAALTQEGLPVCANALWEFWGWWHKQHYKMCRLLDFVPKKPDARSPLQTLPPNEQAELIEMLNHLPQAEVLKRLHARGIQCSKRTLTAFRGWWYASRVMTDAEFDANIFMQKMAAYDPNLTEEELARRGNQHFCKLAIINDDARGWVRTQRLSLDQARFKWNVESAAKREPEESESRGENLFDDPVKLEAARRLVFGEAVAEEPPEYRKEYSSNGSIIRVEGQPAATEPLPLAPANVSG